MRFLVRDLRCYSAEILIEAAFKLLPEDSPEKLALSYGILRYQEMVAEILRENPVSHQCP